MMAIIQFRPLQEETLAVLVAAWETEGEDSAAAYSRLISATMMAAAILDLSPEQVAEHAKTFMPVAKKALAERPDIFGHERKPS